jgi:hypothetical protein
MKTLFVLAFISFFAQTGAFANYDITIGGVPVDLIDNGKPLHSLIKFVIHPFFSKWNSKTGKWEVFLDNREFHADLNGRVELPLIHFLPDDPLTRFSGLIQLEVTYVPQLGGVTCPPVMSVWGFHDETLSLLSQPITDRFDDSWMLNDQSPIQFCK